MWSRLCDRVSHSLPRVWFQILYWEYFPHNLRPISNLFSSTAKIKNHVLGRTLFTTWITHKAGLGWLWQAASTIYSSWKKKPQKTPKPTMREKKNIYCERHLGDHLLSKQISLTASESWLKTQFLVITSHKREQIKPQACNPSSLKTGRKQRRHHRHENS